MLSSFVIFNNGARQREMGRRVVLANVCSRPANLFPQRMFRATFAPALRAANRNRSEVELQRLVPILLFAGAKNKFSAALYARVRFIKIKVLRYMMCRTVNLLMNVSSDCAGRHRRLIVRVMLPPLVCLSVPTFRLPFYERNVSKEWMPREFRTRLREGCGLAALLLAISWNPFVRHLNKRASLRRGKNCD